MSLRKQLILIMLLLVALTTSLHSLISGNYIDKYFTGFVQRQYDQQVKKISEYALSVLGNPNVNLESAAVDLSRYIEDPVTHIAILSPSGETLLSAETKSNNGMMHGKMMGRRFQIQQDQYLLKENEQVVGTLMVQRNATIQNSESVYLFKEALMLGSFISGGIILVLAIAMVMWLSRKMTKDLNQTATFASALQSSDKEIPDMGYSSKISEINAIQMSLKDLAVKLKLQQQIQKEKADQLTHEARTPLTLLKTHVEGVMDGVIDMDQSRLESCLHQIDALTQVLGNISNVVSIEDETAQAHPVSFDLSSDLKKIVKGMRMILHQKSIDLQMDFPSELNLTSDPVLVSQILYNLLTNASKFTPQGGKIMISASKLGTPTTPLVTVHSSVTPLVTAKPSEILRISVCDSGPGIAPEQFELIFNAYYRSPEVRQIPGEGLGLYIAKRNADLLGATLSVSNRPEGGACFTLDLPLF